MVIQLHNLEMSWLQIALTLPDVNLLCDPTRTCPTKPVQKTQIEAVDVSEPHFESTDVKRCSSNIVET